jgi:DNA-binding transcriptional LysR family regulator
MATEGLGIAVIPKAIVETEIANGRLQLLKTDLEIPPITFAATWLRSPDASAVKLVADIAVDLARQGGATLRPVK